MKLGLEVGLGPGHIVLDGYPAPPLKKGATALSFRPVCLSVCGRVPTLLHGPGCNLGEW